MSTLETPRKRERKKEKRSVTREEREKQNIDPFMIIIRKSSLRPGRRTTCRREIS
jgi:hypothetical protein